VAALANAELKVLEECGHFVEMEKPHELATLVSDFINKRSAKRQEIFRAES
jgi:pimeloyl-ACP methyl ester carboxylesterase